MSGHMDPIVRLRVLEEENRQAMALLCAVIRKYGEQRDGYRAVSVDPDTFLGLVAPAELIQMELPEVTGEMVFGVRDER